MNMMVRGQKNLDRRQALGMLQSSQLDNEEDMDGMKKYFHDWQNQDSADKQFSRAQYQKPPALNQQKKVSWEEEQRTSRPMSREQILS